MCGIAGLFNLHGGGPVDRVALRMMGRALAHRGPDEEGTFATDGLGLVARRLTIIDVEHGQQPMSDPSGNVTAILNGEIYDISQHRKWLEERGHRLRTHCDTELIPHYYIDSGVDFLQRLNGQFATAIFDKRNRSLLIARDRYGIAPLYYTTSTRLGPQWLAFASEMKAFFAAGLLKPQVDPRGLDQVMNFIAVPGPRSCFKGISLLPQGHFLQIPSGKGSAVDLRPVCFSRFSFPTHDEEYIDGSETELVDRFEHLLVQATERRLAADVPVGTYLSGGVDSSLITAMTTRIMGKPPATFSIAMNAAGLDESGEAAQLARSLGGQTQVVGCDTDVTLANFSDLIRAAEAPVVDTSAVAMMKLSERVNRFGLKVVLTGEGSDEFLGGYPWFRVANILETLDAVTNGMAGSGARTGIRRWIGQDKEARNYDARCRQAAGGNNAFHSFFSLITANRRKFYSDWMLESVNDVDHYAPLAPPAGEIARWHPMNRAIYWGARTFLPGHLLSLKGDRVAMANSVETRYPFLDDDVIAFVSALHPKWKIRRGRSKYLLRRVAERWLPEETAWRQKRMLRGPSGGRWIGKSHPLIDHYLSREALERTGYFDADRVMAARRTIGKKTEFLYAAESEGLGLIAVLATQVWHDVFLAQADAGGAYARERGPVEIAVPQQI